MNHIGSFRRAVAVAALLAASGAGAEVISYSTALGGAVEAPPNASPGTGWATLWLDTTAHTMRLETSFSGLLGNTTAAHIHCCTATPEAGTAGVATQVPNFVGFPLGVTAGAYDFTFDLSSATSWNLAFITANGGSPASAEAALLAGLDSERAYLNIHTTQFLGGEIRGFLTRDLPEPALPITAITRPLPGWGGSAGSRGSLFCEPCSLAAPKPSPTEKPLTAPMLMIA